MLDRFAAFFLRNKTPFENVRTAESWWKPLDHVDAATQLKKVGDAISATLRAGKMPATGEALQSLLWLDNAVQPAFESLCQMYVANRRMPKEVEQQLSKDVCDFAQRLIEAYQYFIRQSKSEHGLSIPGVAIPQAVVRSLRYLAVQAKWHYFHFEAVPAKLWRKVHQFYLISEMGGFAEATFPAYTRLSTENTSCACEYLHLLMLATVSSANFSVDQIDRVDRWLESWSKMLKVSRQYQHEHHHYFVCLQNGHAPKKVSAGAQEKTCRYWGIAELVSRLQDTLSALASGAAPVSLGLGGGCNAAGTTELLRTLEAVWSMGMRNSQIQRDERKKVSKKAHITYGLDNLCVHVKEDNDLLRKEKSAVQSKGEVDYDEIMDMRLYGFISERTLQKSAITPSSAPLKQLHWKTWVIDNESVSGLGAVLAYNENTWVRPGALLGVRDETRNNWGVGILRRLSRINEDEVYAGIQMLTNAPVVVRVHSGEIDRAERMMELALDPYGNIEMPNSQSVVHTGIYLPHKIGTANVNTLIMHSADYGHGRICQVTSGNKAFSVSLGKVLEKGVDWTWVSVDVLKQES